MNTLRLILMILALFSLFIAALDISTAPATTTRRINTLALGLCLWLLSEMIRR